MHRLERLLEIVPYVHRRMILLGNLVTPRDYLNSIDTAIRLKNPKCDVTQRFSKCCINTRFNKYWILA